MAREDDNSRHGDRSTEFVIFFPHDSKQEQRQMLVYDSLVWWRFLRIAQSLPRGRGNARTKDAIGKDPHHPYMTVGRGWRGQVHRPLCF